MVAIATKRVPVFAQFTCGDDDVIDYVNRAQTGSIERVGDQLLFDQYPNSNKLLFPTVDGIVIGFCDVEEAGKKGGGGTFTAPLEKINGFYAKTFYSHVICQRLPEPNTWRMTVQAMKPGVTYDFWRERCAQWMELADRSSWAGFSSEHKQLYSWFVQWSTLYSGWEETYWREDRRFADLAWPVWKDREIPTAPVYEEDL